MSDISNQLIKDSYNYVLQSDLATGVVYRIGGLIPVNPIFQSGLTVNQSFTYSDGSEQLGYVLTCDALGNATWSPVSAATPASGVTSITVGEGLSANSSTGAVTIVFTGSTGITGEYLPLSGGTVTGDTIFTSGISVNTLTANTSNFDSLYVSNFTEVHYLDVFNASNFYFSANFLQDITVNGTVYANTVSATTYLNYPDSYVTGFSLNNNIITLSQNRTDSYSSFTISLSAYTGSTGVSGDYLPLSGGTLTGGLVANSGVTASTISQTNHIDFTTGSTNPLQTGGRLFFDNVSKALSYYDVDNSLLPIAMGQQLYIRVYNATGIQIDKGKVIAITGTSNSLPSAILAVNNHAIGSDRPIGVAAENILPNREGLVITNGILSGITLNTFANGDTLYLSDTIPGGYVSSTSSLAFSARTNEIGYVLETGTTTGKIYVNINNEDSNLTLTDIERNILEGNVISSGVYEYTGMTIGTGATINVAQARGWIVRNTYEFATLPDVTNLYYTGGTNIPLTYLSTADSTFILINSASTLVQQTTFPTPQERRENIFLGKVVHPSRTSITSINQTVDFDVSPMAALRDLWTPLKLINQGVLVSYHSTTLEINTSAGILWGNGIGWTTNQQNPDSVSIPGTSPTTFQYRTRFGPITGGTVPSGNTTTIYPGYWDNNGVVTAVGGGSNESTNQRVYLFPTGLVRIQLGQKEYSTLAAAVAGAQTEQFTEYSLNRENGILIGIISVNKNATNLSLAAQAVFNLVSKFGEVLGGTGGLSTTTLQQAYDNSSEPEIVINSTLDGLSIKNGTGSGDTVTSLIQGLNTAGTVTSFIRADGAISGSTFFGNGGNLTHIFNSVRINNTPQFSASTNTFINFSGINLTITSGANNTLIFSAGTGGSGGSGTSITSGVFTYTGNTFSGGTLTLTDTNNNPIIIPGLRDTFVTGGTYNGSNILFTNNSGGTFTVTGLTATGFSENYYASFSDSTNQPVSGANIPTVWKYNTTEIFNGISVVDNTKITVQNAGVYEIGYSPQIEKTQGTDALVTIWASINGNPVVRSSSTFGLVANSTLQLPFVSFIFELNANDYVEFYFSSNNQYVQLTALSGLTTPTRPDSPSVIIVAKQVGLSTTAGATGDTFVTGFSLSNDVISLRQNRTDQYSAFTISLSAYTGSTGVSGDYLALSGGTVTGATNFTAGLTANTISATTYYNLPTDIRTTGATYSNNTFTFTNNTGGTYSVLFNTITGLTVNGGLTANTISATTYYNLPQYDAGLLTNSDQWINNNDGTVTLPTAYVALYSQTGYPNTVQVYIVTGGTSGTEFPALSNNDTNYVVIKYNGGSPIWDILTDNSTINGETIVLTHIIYRANNFIHVLDFGNDGFALPNKLNDRVIAIDRFGRESGFSLGLSGSTGVVTLTAGIAWNGTNRQSLVAVNSQDDIFFQNYHSGGNWVYTTSSNTLNNLYYDNGTNPVLAAGGKYLVNWYFRGQEINDHLYEVWGNDEYDNVSEAQLSTEPNLPELITSHAFLTGRIIVQVSATTGLVESAFVRVFQPSTVQAHNDLTGIQGGQAGEYYHLTSTQYSNVAYKNITNIFTSDQIFNNSITSTTISATTYYNLPVSGLTEGENISITGSNGNFTISFTGTTGSNFTGGTVSGATIFTDGLTANTISAATYYNLPVSAVTSGDGISASTSNGTVTIVNTQVQGITGKTDGDGISSSISNNVITITNTRPQGITGITANDGLSGDTTNFATIIINTDKGSSQNIFKNIQIGGITQFGANSNNSDLNFSGVGITITSASTNTLVFTNAGVTSITTGYGVSADTSTGNVTIVQVFDYGKAYTTGNNLNFL